MGALLNSLAYCTLAGGACLAQAAEEFFPAPPAGQSFWQTLDKWDVILSVLILVDVAMLIYAVFGQRTQVRLSPEREAAIATGHTDRRTIFESPVIKHLMWFLLSLSHRVALPRAKNWIHRRLVAAGNPDYYTPEEYVALAMASGTVLGTLLLVVYVALLGSLSPTIFLIGLTIGFFLSVYQIYDRAEKRVRLISKRVPYSLDLISLAMGAGATFTEAVQTVVREETDDPFNIELKTMLAEMDLGSTRRKALRNLAERVPLDSLRSIVASVRILVPSLLILIAVVIAIFGPAILRIAEKGVF